MTARGRNGFTLLEMLVAIAILAIATGITAATFWTISKAWQRGVDLTEDLNHGDFVLDQLTLGLRSAYYPDGKGVAPAYGFWLEDDGQGESARDSICWVKQGDALVADESPFASIPHRVKFSVEDMDGKPAAAVRVWRPYGNPEDFDLEEVEPIFLSSQVCGFNCRVATNDAEDELEWEDEWEETNRLPVAVEITIYLEPVEEGGAPVQLKRLVAVPVSHLSWGK